MKQNDVAMRDASTALLKWFLSKIRFCGDIGIFSSKNSTPGRLTLLGVKFLKSKPIKKFTKMLVFVCIAHLDFVLFYIPFKRQRQRQN